MKRHQWQADFYINGKVRKFYFDNEFDASEKSNQLCHKMGILPQNPEICELLNPQVTHTQITFSLVRFCFCYESQNYNVFEKKEKTSQYKGVYWHKERKTWYVQIHKKGQKPKYGGMFEDELDAAKGVNQLCEKLEIPLKNPEISAIPNQKYQVTFCRLSENQKCENLFFQFFLIFVFSWTPNYY